jgi:hypothetical protein
VFGEIRSGGTGLFAVPKPIEFFEIKTAHPKLFEVQEPYFILQLETVTGATLEIKLQRQTLEYLVDQIKNLPGSPTN